MVLFGLTFWFMLLAVVFWTVEFFWPSLPAQRKWRAGLGTDLLYWFFSPLVTKSISQLIILIALVPFLLLIGYQLEEEALDTALKEGHGLVLLWPRWLQVLVILVGGDFIEYWSHRCFHSRRLWRFHAIHHCSKEVDWLSSVRLHPIDDLGTRICTTVPFVLLGFSPVIIAVYLPFLTVYAFLLHANVSWTFGPFRYVLASPAFHRWHHAKEDEARDKNFAGMFPIYDLLFGTYYAPVDRQPAAFGVHDDSVPEGFLGQLVYPFQPRRPQTTAVATPGHLAEAARDAATLLVDRLPDGGIGGFQEVPASLVGDSDCAVS
jgi:sterol desaturase/sphingolipid hydroxylase (fatty acid hydroxylase superfamily)